MKDISEATKLWGMTAQTGPLVWLPMVCPRTCEEGQVDLVYIDNLKGKSYEFELSKGIQKSV